MLLNQIAKSDTHSAKQLKMQKRDRERACTAYGEEEEVEENNEAIANI